MKLGIFPSAIFYMEGSSEFFSSLRGYIESQSLYGGESIEFFEVQGFYIERKVNMTTRTTLCSSKSQNIYGGGARHFSKSQALYIGRKVNMTTRTMLRSVLRSSKSQNLYGGRARKFSKSRSLYGESLEFSEVPGPLLKEKGNYDDSHLAPPI